jgi:hypothetical protein
MANPEWANMTPTERATYMRGFKRTKILPPMGEQPKLEAAIANRPPETPNPILDHSEGFSFPPPPRPPRDYSEFEPWPVVEAEIEELLEWGLPKYQEIYPRCQYDGVKAFLILACRGGRMRFLRTNTATSLFVAERTPWEPDLFVYQVFVVARSSTGDAYKEAYRLIRSSRRWAEDIGAVGFEFGKARCSTNLQNSADFLKRLSVIVPEHKTELWTKILRPPIEEPKEIAPGARMAAMGMARAEDEPRGIL